MALILTGFTSKIGKAILKKYIHEGKLVYCLGRKDESFAGEDIDMNLKKFFSLDFSSNSFELNLENIFNQINDIAFPPNTVIDIPSSLIMGSDENWFGQLFFISELDANEVFAYFKEHMPDTGWFLIMEQQTKQSFLVYEKDNRVAILNILRNKRGSKATMAVGPRAGLN